MGREGKVGNPTIQMENLHPNSIIKHFRLALFYGVYYSYVPSLMIRLTPNRRIRQNRPINSSIWSRTSKQTTYQALGVSLGLYTYLEYITKYFIQN